MLFVAVLVAATRCFSDSYPEITISKQQIRQSEVEIVIDWPNLQTSHLFDHSESLPNLKSLYKSHKSEYKPFAKQEVNSVAPFASLGGLTTNKESHVVIGSQLEDDDRKLKQILSDVDWDKVTIRGVRKLSSAPQGMPGGYPNLNIPYEKRGIFGKYVFFNGALWMGIFSSFIILGIMGFAGKCLRSF